MMSLVRFLVALGFLTGCQTTPEVTFDLEAPIPENFSEMGFFQWENGEMKYGKRVVPYALNVPLFSDFALKTRAMYVPDEGLATMDGNEVLAFPVGSVLLKTFSFAPDLRNPELDLRLVETRVLVHYPGGWKVFPYIWNEEMTEAVLYVEGMVKSIEFIDEEGAPKVSTYLIPQRNQCFECHEMKDEEGERYLTPIGPRPRYLNRGIQWKGKEVNQLELLVSEGLLAETGSVESLETAVEIEEVFAQGIEALGESTIAQAARDYLDINCAHCHRPNGISGITSQLFLNVENTDAFHLGVCKRPGSAGEGTGGYAFDIVPGDAESSILHFRMRTEEVGAMMPLIGRSLVHQEAADLVGAWINQMSPDTCEE